jgi:hypothetical protein
LTLDSEDSLKHIVVEALVGTLRAAKKRGVVSYKSEMLLQGAHDDVDIVLLQE